jgi:hypothetical protein
MRARSKIAKLSYLVLLPLGLILLFTYSWQDQVRLAWVETTRYKLLLYNGPTAELFGDKKLEQTFIANYPGLAQVDILFRGDDHIPGKQTVIFHLKSSCTSPDDLVSLPPEPLQDRGVAFYPFSFPAIDDSAGQSYCIVLEAPEATAENPILLQLSSGDLYPYGELRAYNPQTEPNHDNLAAPPSVATNLSYKIYLPFIVGQPENNIYVEDIGFQLHYEGLLLPTAQVFVTRLTANKPYWLGRPWFYGGVAIIYIILVAGLFYVGRRTTSLDR